MGNSEPRRSTWQAFKARMSRRRPQDPTVQFLVKLYSHALTPEDFQNISLETEHEILRNDLEFYILQFINFLLCEFTESNEEVTNFVFLCCKSSVRFAHKVIWFLQSCRHPEWTSQAQELAHLVEIISRESFAMTQTDEESKRVHMREIMTFYNDLPTYGSMEPINEELIPISGFPKRNIRDNFMSTLWLVTQFELIAETVLRSSNRQLVLESEIKKLNLILPAKAYIPFPMVSSNSVILHIPHTELKVFETKERAPCLLTIEIYNPTEELFLKEDENEEDSNTSQNMSSSYTRSVIFANEELEYMREDLAGFKSEISFRKSSKLVRNTSFPRRDTVAVVYDSSKNLKRESFENLASRIRRRSPFGDLRTWKILRVIVKAGDDLLQEQIAMQVAYKFKQVFYEAKLNLWIRPYEILSISPKCGLVECINDAYSIDSIKKSLPATLHSLLDYFRMQFGPLNSRRFKKAEDNFTKSLAAYSLFCFVMQIKDRHNGNILLDSEGHIVHIDFGFILNHAPGMGFENVPFKLTTEFLEVMEGNRSSAFLKFRKLCVQGFLALRRRSEEILLLIEMMRNGVAETVPCYIDGDKNIEDCKSRLNLQMSDLECKRYINGLIDESLDNWRTNWYDRYQFCCQNIFY